jgi:hypothetical protein
MSPAYWFSNSVESSLKAIPNFHRFDLMGNDKLEDYSIWIAFQAGFGYISSSNSACSQNFGVRSCFRYAYNDENAG